MKKTKKPTKKNPRKSLGRQLGLPIAVIIIVAIILVLQNPFTFSSSPSTLSQGNTGVGTKIGQLAPEFTLKTVDGKTVSLSDFRGKPVVVNFWATWCPFCVDELPNFEKVGQEFGDSVVIISINRAEPVDRQLQGLKEYQATSGVTFTRIMFLDDPNDEMANVYSVQVMPTTYFIDENGIIKDRKFGEVFPDEFRSKLQSLLGNQ